MHVSHHVADASAPIVRVYIKFKIEKNSRGLQSEKTKNFLYPLSHLNHQQKQTPAHGARLHTCLCVIEGNIFY